MNEKTCQVALAAGELRWPENGIARWSLPTASSNPLIIILKSVVNFTGFVQNWPKIERLALGSLQQSIDFRKTNISPPGF